MWKLPCGCIAQHLVKVNTIISAFDKSEITQKEDEDESNVESSSASEQSDESDIDNILLSLFNSDIGESDFEGFV